MGEKNLPSKKQRELLSFIDGFIKGNGYGPSYREIMRALDYRSVSTVAVQIDGLIVKGYVNKRDNSARSLEITTPHISGNTVEKSDTNPHEVWLVGEVMKQLKVFEAEPTDEKKAPVRTLIAALQVLELHDAHAKLEKRLANLSKQLDQTAE